jgi:hypothetical protein
MIIIILLITLVLSPFTVIGFLYVFNVVYQVRLEKKFEEEQRKKEGGLTMPEVKMRFRTDQSYDYYIRALIETAENPLDFVRDKNELKRIKKLEPAKPGDTWRIKWHSTDTVAGYIICCPKCLQLHHWTTANNCSKDVKDGICVHSRSTDGGELGSCWEWTGSAEENTLTASPSLHASGACGYHGWLRNGILTEC